MPRRCPSGRCSVPLYPVEWGVLSLLLFSKTYLSVSNSCLPLCLEEEVRLFHFLGCPSSTLEFTTGGLPGCPMLCTAIHFSGVDAEVEDLLLTWALLGGSGCCLWR
jgi:hypothetical protein